MKTRLLIIIGMNLPLMSACLFAVVFLPVPVYASCASPPLFAAEFFNFERAHTVFVGTVTEIYNPHPEIHTGEEEYDTITFDVHRILKGNTGEGTVTTGHSSTGYNDFVIGKTYLVFAFGGLREVSQCTPPILLSGESAFTLLEGKYYFPLIVIAVAVSVACIIIARRRK